MNKPRKIIIQKPDLDTCLTALILGVSYEDEVIVSRGNVSPEALADRGIICIECDGSGQVDNNNFDHHDREKSYPPACRQAYDACGRNDDKLKRLVDYVCMVDIKDQEHPRVAFPSLSNLFSGMLFAEDDFLAQFSKGIVILEKVLADGINPFDTMPDYEEWRTYRAAKEENNRRLQEELNKVIFYQAENGMKIGYSESEVIGGFGALYRQGCHVAVLFNPAFGNPPVRKYTIAGDGVQVIHLLPYLDELEKGWGGRETIIGSPRTGSILSTDQVLKEVMAHL